MRYSSKISVFLSVLILSACTVTKTICPCEAPEVIRLGDKEIEINAQVSLIDTTASSKMRVIIRLTTIDHSTLPANFEADSYYLRSSDLVRDAFEGKLIKKNSDHADEIMELEAIDAPHWRQGELVICRRTT